MTFPWEAVGGSRCLARATLRLTPRSVSRRQPLSSCGISPRGAGEMEPGQLPREAGAGEPGASLRHATWAGSANRSFATCRPRALTADATPAGDGTVLVRVVVAVVAHPLFEEAIALDPLDRFQTQRKMMSFRRTSNAYSATSQTKARSTVPLGLPQKAGCRETLSRASVSIADRRPLAWEHSVLD